MYILLYVCTAAVMFFAGKEGYTGFLQMRCKGSVTGRFLYLEKRMRVFGRYVEPCWNPVYEYCVGKATYKVEVEAMYPNDRIEAVNVEVTYLPSNPEICFVNGLKGRIRGRKKRL